VAKEREKRRKLSRRENRDARKAEVGGK